jgi:hypothetical protein
MNPTANTQPFTNRNRVVSGKKQLQRHSLTASVAIMLVMEKSYVPGCLHRQGAGPCDWAAGDDAGCPASRVSAAAGKRSQGVLPAA